MPTSDFVKFSNAQAKAQNKEHYLYNHIFVYIKDELPNNINISSVLDRIEKTIPSFLAQEIDDIFIGQFEDFITRDVNAIFKDGAIYVTNNQSSEKDLLDDIIHEMAHAVEKQIGFDLYHDGELEKEFISKRHQLWRILSEQDKFKHWKADNGKSLKLFLEPSYSLFFDKLLYKVIKYPLLQNLTSGLFPSAYSITSLREYFAIGFEEYYIYNRGERLKTICPYLYKKLDMLDDMSHNV